jgi:hypothetical protein
MLVRNSLICLHTTRNSVSTQKIIKQRRTSHAWTISRHVYVYTKQKRYRRYAKMPKCCSRTLKRFCFDERKGDVLKSQKQHARLAMPKKGFERCIESLKKRVFLST